MNNSIVRTVLVMSFFVLLLSCKSDAENDKNKSSSKVYNLRGDSWRSKQITYFSEGINYTATEVPLQYYLLKNSGLDAQGVDSLYQHHIKERIFELEFEHENKDDLLKETYTRRNYEASVKYMAFTITKDFSAVTMSQDTIPCSGTHFERNFKVAPFKRLLLYFEGIAPNENITLLYKDQLFGNGLVTFDFNETPLKL